MTDSRTLADVHADQLLGLLQGVVASLNEALTDKYVFNFQISQTPEGKFALASLACTQVVFPHAA